MGFLVVGCDVGAAVGAFDVGRFVGDMVGRIDGSGVG